MASTGKSLDREKSGQEMFPAGKCLRPGNVRPGKDWRGNVMNRGMFGEGKSGRGLATGKNRSAFLPVPSKAQFKIFVSEFVSALCSSSKAG